MGNILEGSTIIEMNKIKNFYNQKKSENKTICVLNEC